MFKKNLILVICFNILALPAYCTIRDDLVEKTLCANQKIKQVQPPVIEDTFANKTLDNNLKPKSVNANIISDTFAENNKNKNQYRKPMVDFSEQTVVVSQKPAQVNKVVIYSDADSIPVKIRIKKYLSTRQKNDEGDTLDFETVSEVKIKNKVYPAGTTVKARIETISYNKVMGVPSDLVVGNFLIDNNPLSGEINKIGANRSLWLYPTVYLTSCFFGAGLLLIPIRGGHAKIRPNQHYTVYYK